MTLHATVVSFIVRSDAVIPHKTLTTSQKESADYKWSLISEGNYLCNHGDKSYVVMVDGDKIGCSCPAMSFHCKGNDVCKHLTAFIGLSDVIDKHVPKNMVPELLKAGWTGGPGALNPPATKLPAFDEVGNEVSTGGVETTSDEDGEDNGSSDPVPPDSGKKPVPPEPNLGEKVFERVCPHCGEVARMTDEKLAGAWLTDHVATCKKKPQTAEPRKTSSEVPVKENTKMDEQIQRVIAEATGLGATDIDEAYVRDKLDQLQIRFKVIRTEAERCVVTAILNARGITRPSGKAAPNVLLGVGLIDSPKQWVNIRVRVVKLWSSESESIRQVGLVGDETGTTKFVSWVKSDLVLIEPDKCYSIQNVVTDEYDGRFSVKFTKNTLITEIDDDIKVEYASVEFTGMLTGVQDGSGLIKRCPTCNAATKAGACKEHGNVNGVHDMRIKATLDDGVRSRGILLNRDLTTQLTGIDMDAAIAFALEALDMGVVSERMAPGLVGKEFVVTGSDMGDTILVESIKEVTTVVSSDDVKNLLAEVN